MSQSVEKQAIPIEFFDRICTNEKLQILIDNLWGCGYGMFSWFTAPPITRSGYLPSRVEEFKQDYKPAEEILGYPFRSEGELEAYCTLLEQCLEQLKLDDPLIVHRYLYLDNRIDEQIYLSLLEELKVKFPALDSEFADTAIWGGERIHPKSDLRYLSPDQVSAIDQVLRQIEVNELLRHFDASRYDSEQRLKECCETIQALKSCFAETAEQGQIILTKIN